MRVLHACFTHIGPERESGAAKDYLAHASVSLSSPHNCSDRKSEIPVMKCSIVPPDEASSGGD